jgi:hypothetical protein
MGEANRSFEVLKVKAAKKRGDSDIRIPPFYFCSRFIVFIVYGSVYSNVRFCNMLYLDTHSKIKKPEIQA